MSALKLSPAQRADLRSQAHALKPIVLVGAEGLTDAMLKKIECISKRTSSLRFACSAMNARPASKSTMKSAIA